MKIKNILIGLILIASINLVGCSEETSRVIELEKDNVPISIEDLSINFEGDTFTVTNNSSYEIDGLALYLYDSTIDEMVKICAYDSIKVNETYTDEDFQYAGHQLTNVMWIIPYKKSFSKYEVIRYDFDIDKYTLHKQ